MGALRLENTYCVCLILERRHARNELPDLVLKIRYIDNPQSISFNFERRGVPNLLHLIIIGLHFSGGVIAIVTFLDLLKRVLDLHRRVGFCDHDA